VVVDAAAAALAKVTGADVAELTAALKE